MCEGGFCVTSDIHDFLESHDVLIHTHMTRFHPGHQGDDSLDLKRERERENKGCSEKENLEETLPHLPAWCSRS